jgi:hypothetical protein|tara:strand:+ start:307 stop:654 length:348 start_codon:yes stop_codon:yes gene_type:complete
MSHLQQEKKIMNDKYIKEIRKALTEIVGLNKLGYDFEIKRGRCQSYGTSHADINDPIWVDGFFVEIDYDFWNDEKHKSQTVYHLARYFPNIKSFADDVLCHISLDSDNFGEISNV